MRNRPIRTLLTGLFLLLPLLVFQLGQREKSRLTWEDLRQDEERQMYYWLERAKSFASLEFQLQEILGRFAHPVLADTVEEGEKILSYRYLGLIKPILPRHDLLLVREVSKEMATGFEIDGGFGLKKVMIDFCRVLRVNPKRPESERKELSRRLAKSLRDELSLTVLVDNLRRGEGDAQIIRSAEGDRILFWSLIRRRKNPKADWVVLALFDLKEFPPNFPFSSLARSWSVPGCGLAYLHGDSTKTIASAFFRDHQEILHELIERSPQGRGKLFSEVRGDYLVSAGVPLPGGGGQPVMVKFMGEPIHRAAREDQVQFLSLLLLWGVAFWHVVEHLVFGRRTWVGVRTLISGAFILAALLPLSSARHMLERSLSETFRRENQVLRKGLQAAMENLDEGERVFLSSFSAYLKDFTSIPAVASEVDRVYHSCPGPASFTPWLVDRIARAIPVPLRWVLVVGPDGSTWCGDPPKPGKVISQWESNILTRVLGKIYHEYLRSRNPALRSSREAASWSKVDKAEVEKELFLESIAELIGARALFKLAFQPMVCFGLRTQSEINSNSGTLVRIGGKPGFLLKRFWQNIFLNEEFLRSHLGTGSSPTQLAGSQIQAFLGASSPSRGYPFTVVETQQRDPGLYRLVVQAFQFGHSVRIKELLAPGKPLLEIVPGGNFVGIMVGKAPTAPLEEAAATRRWWYYFWLGMALLTSVLIGQAGAEYFLRPLQELARKVGAIREGRFETRMDEGRGDEFGSLGRAFNLLAQGLEEGKVLERYVSESVIDAVGKDDTQTVRKTAEVCAATILFSGLHGFDEFARERSGLEVVVPLRDHLDVCDEAVRKFGGEIDKMIGDKVMMVFRHGEFHDDRAGVSAALKVARWIRARLAAKECRFSPVMGMNTGMVISGILGAPKVRLDHTVIGDPVNLAARLCTLAHTTSGTHVVISGECLRWLAPKGDGDEDEDEVKVSRLPFLHVKGKTQQIEAFLLE